MFVESRCRHRAPYWAKDDFIHVPNEPEGGLIGVD